LKKVRKKGNPKKNNNEGEGEIYRGNTKNAPRKKDKKKKKDQKNSRSAIGRESGSIMEGVGACYETTQVVK